MCIDTQRREGWFRKLPPDVAEEYSYLPVELAELSRQRAEAQERREQRFDRDRAEALRGI
jgi:hypothetical protein